MRLLFLAASAALLAGCQTSDERQTAQCAGYGFPAGTEQFAQCKMTLDIQDRQQRADIVAAARQTQLQTQAQAAAYQPLPYSLQAGPQKTSCHWQTGNWICRPAW